MANKDKVIAVVGLGGLGGFVCEFLCRLGFKKIIIVDGDKFSESNLNRQLLANKTTLGTYKVDNYVEFLTKFSQSEIAPFKEYLNKENIKVLDEADIIMDCIDNVKGRLLLEEYAEKTNKVIVHGAIGENFGNVCLCMPGDKTLSKLYKNNDGSKYVTYSYAVATIAAAQTELLGKYLENKHQNFVNKIIYIDLDDFIIKHMPI